MCRVECKINGVNLALGIPALLQIAICITALYYGITNLENMCSDSFVHLAVWLIVHGAVMAFVTVGFFPSICFGSIGMLVYGIVASLYGLFNVIWSIIGGVILWRDSKDCEEMDPSFYTASMVVVILSLITSCCFLCCGSNQTRDSAQGDNNA